MALEERAALALEGCVIADVAVVRPSRPPSQQRQAPTSDASAAPEDQHEQEEVRFKSTAVSGQGAGAGLARQWMRGIPGVPYTDHMGFSSELAKFLRRDIVMLWQDQAQQRLRARVRVKTLAMWTDQGRLGQELCKVMLLYS